MNDPDPSPIFQPVRVSIDYLPAGLSFEDLDRVIMTGALSVYGPRRRRGFASGGSASSIHEFENRPGERMLTVLLEAVADDELRVPCDSMWGGAVDYTMEADELGNRVLWQMVHGHSGGGGDEAAAVADALDRAGVAFGDARAAAQAGKDWFWSFVAPEHRGLVQRRGTAPGHLLWLEGGNVWVRSAEDENAPASDWAPQTADGELGDLPWVVADPATPRPDDPTLKEALWSIIGRPVPAGAGGGAIGPAPTSDGPVGCSSKRHLPPQGAPKCHAVSTRSC